MAIINGREVIGMTWADEREFIDEKNRHLLLQHRTKYFYHLVDRLRMVNPDLDTLLCYVKDNVSVNMYKTIRGRIIGLMLIRYTNFLLHPQWYAHKGDLIFFANYFHIQQYLQRMVKVLICNYDYPDRYYGFKIKKHKLLKMSELFAQGMLPTVEKKMLPHYKKLMDRKEK